MKENLKYEIFKKIIELGQFGNKRVIGDFLKGKLDEKYEKDKIAELSIVISDYIFEEDVKERMKDYIEKDIFNNVKNISILSTQNRNNFIEGFFEKHGNYSGSRKEIEKILKNYLQKVEEYQESILSKKDKIFIKKINEVDENNKKDHKSIEEALKETKQSVIKAIREKDKLGIISIEEKETIEFDIQNVESNPEDAIYNFFGSTVDFTASDKISSKLLMKMKIKNVGTDFLYNITVKNFSINSIDEFEYDEYSYIEVCSYTDNCIIKNTMLPGTSNQINFIFDPFTDEGNFNYGIFQDLSDTLDINFSFDIKSKYGDIMTQEFQIYCSRIEGDDKKYLIESVTNIFDV